MRLWTVVAFGALTAASWLAADALPGSVTANGLRFFDATYEQSIPTVFSTLLLVGAACLVAALGLRTHRLRRRWWLLAGVLAFLALDEVVGSTRRRSRRCGAGSTPAGRGSSPG